MKNNNIDKKANYNQFTSNSPISKQGVVICRPKTNRQLISEEESLW